MACRRRTTFEASSATARRLFMHWESCAPTACPTWRCRPGHLQIGRHRQTTVRLQCFGGIYYSGQWTASRLDAFLRRSIRCGFCPSDIPPFEELLKASDEQLFSRITHNRHHLLSSYLPSQSLATQNYDMRPRIHNRQLPDRSGHLTDCNFLTRLLYNDIY